MRTHKHCGSTLATISMALGVGLAFMPSQSALAQTTQTKQRYAVIQLGDFGGGFSKGYGINEDGTVVGSAHYPSLMYHPMRWQNGTSIDLDPDFPYDAQAYDINEVGQVVGRGEFDGINLQNRAWLWDGEGGIVELGTFGGVESEANAINNAGLIVGEAEFDPDSSRVWPCVWENGQIRSLLPNPCEGCTGSGKGISESGWIAGYLESADIDGAVLWDPDGNVIDLDPGDDRLSIAFDVNDAGMAVGYLAQGNGEPALWDENHNLVRIDPSTFEGSTADAINNHGIIVGRDLNGRDKGAIWDQNREKHNLNHLVAPRNKWWITDAWDINDNNQIAGECVQDNGDARFHGVLLTPVTPRFAITEPVPGIAGEMNEITARGGDLEPGMRVNFYWGVRGGGTMFPSSSCDILGAVLQIENARFAGNAIADANGIATLRGVIPMKAKDQIVLLQAMVPKNETSNNKCMQSSFVIVQFE